jgi:hypothetical protein
MVVKTCPLQAVFYRPICLTKKQRKKYKYLTTMAVCYFEGASPYSKHENYAPDYSV